MARWLLYGIKAAWFGYVAFGLTAVSPFELSLDLWRPFTLLACGWMYWYGTLVQGRTEGRRNAQALDQELMEAFGWECFQRGARYTRDEVRQALDRAAFEAVMEQHLPSKSGPPS